MQFHLTHKVPVLPSYRNQSTDLLYMKFLNLFIYLSHDNLISKLTRAESCTKMPFTLNYYLNFGIVKYMDCFIRTMRFYNQP